MHSVARAFAVLALAVASRSHRGGADELGAVEQQQLVDSANRAQFEHLVLSGASVDAVRSYDGTSWCGIVRLSGRLVTICNLAGELGGRPLKSRRVTCPRCVAALGA